MKENWIFLSLIALFSLGSMSFLITTLTRKGYPVSFVLLGLGIVLAVFYFFQTFIFASYTPKLSLGIILMLLLVGLLSAIGNWTAYQAANNAPNAGLAIAISGMQAGLVTVLAFIFLRDKLSFLQIVGLVLGIIAIFIINIGSNMGAEKSQTKITNQALNKGSE